MSDTSGPLASVAGGELPVGQGLLGADGIQRAADSIATSVNRLGDDLSSLAGKLSGPGQGSGSAVSAGVEAGAQNQGTGASGTGSGGYASWVKRFATFGQQAGAGGRSGGAFTTFGAGASPNGRPGGRGLGGAVGAGLDVVAAAGAYGNANMNSFMTMNTAATQGMWRSGLAAGGVNASLNQATRMIFGTAGGFQNVTASSAADAASANNILGYTAGVGMYGADGAANPAYKAAQSSMFSMGYANPYMSQTQVAGMMQQVYAPNSVRAMTAMGVKLPSGPVLPQTVSPMQIASSVFSRTFGGAASVNASTMTAATGQGGSLNANIAYLGQQAGWSSTTVNAMETYLQQRNAAVNAGIPASQVDSLLSQAASGNKSAASTLAAKGIGASSVQSVKDLQASQTSNLADQSGGFNTALQQSTSLLTQFNQALGQILSATGLSGAIGSTAGYGSMFGGAAGSIGTNLGMNYAMGRSASAGSGLLGRAGSAVKSRLGFGGATVAAGEGEAAAVGAARMSLGTGLGLGAGAAYALSHVNNSLSSNVYGHKGAGDDWVTDTAKIGGNALSYAAGGALIGSVIPGVGTLAGGLVGGAVGLGQGLWDWFHDKSGYSAASGATGANTAALAAGGYSSGLGNGTGSIGGGTDEGVTGAARPSSVAPAPGAGNAGAATVAKVIAFALAQVGKPYVYAATGPDSYDCSGLTMAAYGAGGIKLPRTSEQQMTSGAPVKPDAAVPGDLLFPYPGHVMMCIGGGMVVEARHTGTVIWTRKYSPGEFIAARRIVSVGDGATQNDAASGGNAATGATASTGAGAGLGASGAGISELQSIQQNTQAATTDRLTANLRVSAANSPFGAASLSASQGTHNPFAANGGAPGAAGPSGSTALTGTVKDRYGHVYKIPTGAKPAGTVSSWISSALTVMGMAQTTDTVQDIKDIISGESGGDPWNINLYDSNAAAGHPSEGLMQTIPSTFSAHALGGHKDIWNPVDNIIAGARYAVATYKSLDNVPGVRAVKAGKPYVGYSSGAWDLAQDQDARVHQHEMVVPARIADAFRAAVNPGAGRPNAGSGVTLEFRPGAIQVSLGGGATIAAAQQTATAIVDGIMNDARVKKMAVGL